MTDPSCQSHSCLGTGLMQLFNLEPAQALLVRPRKGHP